MTTRTELIARLRDSYVPGVNEDLRMAADMLEADEKAARLALDALTEHGAAYLGHRNYYDKAIAALKEVL